MRSEQSPITIVIPTFNSSCYLRATLNSILIQDSSIPIIIADGGSRDNTLSIIHEYSHCMPIHVCSYSDNGQSNGLNKALKHVKSSHTLWLNSDDILFQGAIESFTSYINNHNLLTPYISADTVIFTNNYRLRSQKGCIQPSYYARNGVWVGSFPCVVWNTELLRHVGFLNESFNYSMDYELVMRIARTVLGNGDSINGHIPRYLGGFRTHLASKTSTLMLDGGHQGSNRYLAMNEIWRARQLHGVNRLAYMFFSILLRITNIRIVDHRLSKTEYSSIVGHLQQVHSMATHI